MDEGERVWKTLTGGKIISSWQAGIAEEGEAVDNRSGRDEKRRKVQ